jgi:DinB family protein
LHAVTLPEPLTGAAPVLTDVPDGPDRGRGMSAPPTAAAQLRAEQQRVAEILAGLSADGWAGRLDDAQRAELAARGHFPEYGGELDWSAQQVAGHLRDSARIFTSRLDRLLAGDAAPLPPFDPLDADRVAGYTATPLTVLLADLADAQDRLHAVVAGLTAADLRRAGQRASGDTVTVGELVAFLPQHQGDHAAQLEALAGDGCDLP